MMGTPHKKVIKVPFKNKAFNSTMMASFLPVIQVVSKKHKQTEKKTPFIAVAHKLT